MSLKSTYHIVSQGILRVSHNGTYCVGKLTVVTVSQSLGTKCEQSVKQTDFQGRERAFNDFHFVAVTGSLETAKRKSKDTSVYFSKVYLTAA